MTKITVNRIREDGWVNPFNATAEELLAGALEETGLMQENTLINNQPGHVYYQAYCKKRNLFQEATRLGSMLVKQKIISNMQLDRALAKQGLSNKPLGEILLEMKICSQHDIDQALEQQKSIRAELYALEESRKRRQNLWKRILSFFVYTRHDLPDE